MKQLITMQKHCLTCHKVFHKPLTESVKNWNERHVFCSKKCKHELKPRARVKCRQCGEEFEVQNYRKSKANFCSHECCVKFRDQGKRTADKKIRQSMVYRKWREAVFKRDGYSCVICGDRNYTGRGETVIINADHIKPFALHPELRFDINNGRTLCEPCHRKTKTYGRGMAYRKAA